MKIENRELNKNADYLSSVTYVPSHANGNAGHQDCEQGVIVDFNEKCVAVLFTKTRTVQTTNPSYLVWG